MRGEQLTKRTGFMLVLTLVLAFLVLGFGPAMRVDADSDFTCDPPCDLNEKVDQAVLLKPGSTVSVTKGGKVTATYPARVDYVEEEEKNVIVMKTGEGYLFRYDIKPGTVAFVTPSFEEWDFNGNAQILSYSISPRDYGQGYEWTAECYEWMSENLGTMIYSPDEPLVLSNNYDCSLRNIIFIPKDSSISGLTIIETPITGVAPDGTILIDGSEPADKMGDYVDQAIEVQEGVDFSLQGKTPIEVTVQTEIYYTSWPNVAKTEKVKGYLLHFTNPSEKRWTLQLKDSCRMSYPIYAEEITYLNFSMTNDWFQIEKEGNAPSWYVFVSENIEIDKWERWYTPEDLPEMVEKDKVNIVSWDDDFNKKIEAVTAVYPELKDKVKYINLGVASEELIPVYNDILDGKYNGYTMMFPVDIGSVNKLIDKAPALSKIGYKESDNSNSYKFLTELGTKNGELRAVSWHACPNGFFYDSAIAKKVLGTDDPAKVQEMISTPVKFNEVAKKMKAAGYYMTAGVNQEYTNANLAYSTMDIDIWHGFDTLLKSYRADLYDKKCEMWDRTWADGMTDGTVFGYFGTTWMKGVFSGNGVKNGAMKLCAGPVSYLWGGTFVMAKDLGTQKETACKVLKAITSDEKVVKKIATRKDSSEWMSGDFVNNKAVNESLISAGTLADPFYGGKQDATPVWHEAALKLGKESEIVTGWQDINGKKYYYDSKGVPVKGLKKIGTKIYYFNTTSGVMQTGIQKVSGKSYYFDTKTGEQKTGWQQVGKSWYYFVPKTGVMATGWQQIGKDWFYFIPKTGVMASGWQQVGKDWFYFTPKTGAMVSGWQQIGKAWYYFIPKTGAMASGWQQIGKDWFYFLPKTGVMASGWQKIGKSWYYFVPKTGAMKTGWLSSGGKWYYFNKSGVMVTGSVAIGSKTYKFNSSGVCLNP